jgi:hypothetical protein
MHAPAAGGGMTYLQARTANEVLKAQERGLRVEKLKGQLVDAAQVRAKVFRPLCYKGRGAMIAVW